MEKEFENCIHKYFENQDGYTYLPRKKQGTKNDLVKIIKNFDKLELYDKPDGYILTKNYIYILEHFEIDATKLNKKGSQTRKEESRIDKDFNNVINQSIQDKVLYNEQMQIEISSENLTNNFIKIYLNHYKKIESYKRHLIEEGIANESSRFKICFFVEDVTPLGTFHLNGFRRTTLRISDIKECVQIMQKNSVDYLFLLNQYDNNKSRYFLQKTWLKDISNEAKPYKSIKMFNWKPIDMRMRSYLNKKDD